MINLKKHQNFFSKNWHYILLMIPSVGIFGAHYGCWPVNHQNQPNAVNTKKKKQIGETDHHAINFNRKTNDDYWLIVSFIFYYSVYLLLQLTNNKDKSAFVVVSSIILWKISLAVFNSYHDQTSSFKQNLNRSFNPVYFFHQGFLRVFLSLTGYGTIAYLIYHDLKEPKQQNTELTNKHIISNAKQIKNSQKTNDNILSDTTNIVSDETSKNAINIALNKKNNHDNKNIEKNNKISNNKSHSILNNSVSFNNLENSQEKQELLFFFQDDCENDFFNDEEDKKEELTGFFAKTFASFSNNPFFSEIINLLKERKIFDFTRFIESIEQGVKNKKISASGLEKLIGKETIHIICRIKGSNYFERKEYIYDELPFLERFFTCLHFFFSKSDDDGLKKMTDTYLTKLMNNPSDNEIFSLKKLIDELYFLANCLLNLYNHFFGEFNQKPFYLNKGNFKTVNEIKNFHLNFLRNLIKKSGSDKLFEQKAEFPFDQCRFEEVFHLFLTTDERIKVTEKMFFEALNETDSELIMLYNKTI